jgi:hypothetical protein
VVDAANLTDPVWDNAEKSPDRVQFLRVTMAEAARADQPLSVNGTRGDLRLLRPGAMMSNFCGATFENESGIVTVTFLNWPELFAVCDRSPPYGR